MSVSVILTTHNRLQFLEESLLSVINQNHKPVEIIVVNDHFDSKLSVESFVGLYPNVILINNFENPGANYSRNIGIKHSKGDYVAFLDDDDIWLDNYLLEQMRNIGKNNIGLSYTSYIEFWDSDKPIETYVSVKQPSNNVTYDMSQGLFCPETTSAVIVNRLLILECNGFDTTLSSFQDWDMWYRLSKITKFGVVQQNLVKFRQHMGLRTSVDYSKRLNGLNQISNKWGDELDKSFVKKYTLGCYYANAKKMLMLGAPLDSLKIILSHSIFFKSRGGIKMVFEILVKSIYKTVYK